MAEHRRGARTSGGVIADKSQDGFIFPRIIDHPPKSGGHRVALSFLQGFDFLNRGRLQRTALFPKAIADEQQTSRRVIGFGLDFCVCGSADGRFVIAEHHFPMPQEKVVSDLISLKPSMLGDRGAIIDKTRRWSGRYNARRSNFLIASPSKPGRDKSCYPARFNRLTVERNRPSCSAEKYAKSQLQQFPDIREFQRGFRITQFPEDLIGDRIDFPLKPRAELG